MVDETPGEWQTEIVASLWQDLLQRYPNVVGGYFHSDDMALAAAAIVDRPASRIRSRSSVSTVGKNACEAILEGNAHRIGHQPVRSHPRWLGLGWIPERLRHRQLAGGEMPKFIRADGGPITADNAAGYIWLYDNFQY